MKFFLSASVAVSIGASLPLTVLAQDGASTVMDVPPVWTLDRREQWVDQRIQGAALNGGLSGQEDRRGRPTRSRTRKGDVS